MHPSIIEKFIFFCIILYIFTVRTSLTVSCLLQTEIHAMKFIKQLLYVYEQLLIGNMTYKFTSKRTCFF